MTILITGANGLVGQHMLHFLKSINIPLIACSFNPPNLYNGDIIWRQWDLRQRLSPIELTEKFGDVEAIFHIGAIVPRVSCHYSESDLFDVNVRACQSLAEWALQTNTPIVYLSGAIVYQDPFSPNLSENDLIGYSGLGGFYGYTKYLAEQVFEYYSAIGLQVAVLRASSIYGHGLSTDKLLMKFLHMAQKGETLLLSPPIDDVINLIHAFDIVSAMWNAYRTKAWGIYNVAYTQLYSVYDIACACVSAAKNGRIEVDSSCHISKKPQAKFSLDVSKARKAFDFKPKIDLYMGVQHMASRSFGNE